MKTVATKLPAGNTYGKMAMETLGHPSHLHLVTDCELSGLRQELVRGNVPWDLEQKLDDLAQGSLGHRFIEQNCRTIIALVGGTQIGFKDVTPDELQTLLRVLAYVRKADDAIPDYRPDGFMDDQQEVRAMTTKLSPLLQKFKAWRLRHQVPTMWLNISGRRLVLCA
jgi:hypothetical protein